MGTLGRLLLRFLLVPVGYFVAVVVGTLVIVIGSWQLAPLTAGSGPQDQAMALLGFALASSVLLMMLLGLMWLPAAIGVLLSEAFAIRSWIFHAANGAASAWIGWSLFGSIDDSRIPLNQPSTILAAGLAGGLVYWVIAGSSAGFWRPKLRPVGSALPAPPTTRTPQIRSSM